MSSFCYSLLLRNATRKVGAIYDYALAPLGINIAQFSLLEMIQRRQPVSFTELGLVARLDRSTVGRNARVLERMGLVKARRGEDDLRETVVILTERGSEVLSEATPLWQECQREIETRLGLVKVTTLQDILHSI